MDGSSPTANHTPERSLLLHHGGEAYRFLRPADVKAGCHQPLKFGSQASARTFIARIAGTTAMYHRLHMVAAYWAASFGWGGLGHDPAAGLAEQVMLTRRLVLCRVVCGAAPRGAPKKPEEKKSALLETASTVADNTPVVGPIKSALQVVTGFDLITDEPVGRWGEAAGIALGVVPGGKLVAKGMKKVSETLGKKGAVQSQPRGGLTPEPRFVERHKGPDGMARDPTDTLAELEAKGRKDGSTGVAKDKLNRKQGSAEKNEAYAEKMVTRNRKKVGKPSNRIGGPYTAEEMELWQEVLDNSGKKRHVSTHTNTTTGKVRVFERDGKGNILRQTDEFQLDAFEATKQRLTEEFSK